MTSVASPLATDTEIDDCWCELQEAWSCLREAVTLLPLSTVQQVLLLCIDEGTSWPSVRDLNKMQSIFLEIAAIVNDVPIEGEILYWVMALRDNIHWMLNRIEF